VIGEVVEFGVRQLGAVLSGLGRRRIAFSVWEVRRFLHSWRSAGCGIVGLDWERKCSWWWECRGADRCWLGEIWWVGVGRIRDLVRRLRGTRGRCWIRVCRTPVQMCSTLRGFGAALGLVGSRCNVRL